MAKEKEFLKKKLSLEIDFQIILVGWLLLFFAMLGNLYVYTSFEPSATAYSDASAKEIPRGLVTALEKVTSNVATLGAFVTGMTILFLLDRDLAIKRLRKLRVKATTFTTFTKNTYKMNNFTKVILIVTAFISIPWFLANLGLFATDIPVLNYIFLGVEDFNGYPSVHLGGHHGYKGAATFFLMILVFTTARYFYDKRIRAITGLTASYLLVWGFYNMFEDFFVEQLYKRGLIERIIPQPGPDFEMLFPLYFIVALFIYIFIWKKLEVKK